MLRTAPAAALAAGLLARALLAQGTPADTSAKDTLRRYALPPIVVTASLIPLSAVQVGVATSVLPRADLAAEPTPYLARALTFLPGVSIEEGAGAGGPTSLHLRGGLEPYTQMMFDGVPINISGGFNDIAGLLLSNVDRVEIARGPLSAVWGSSAMAGAVQFITRQGAAGPTQLEALAEGGTASSHGPQARSELSAVGGTPDLRYSAGVGVAYNRGIYTLPTDLVTSDASLRVDLLPAARWTVTTTARYMAVQSNLPVRDPGATRVPEDPNQRDRHYRLLASATAGFTASPTWHHRFTASLLRDDFSYDDAHDSIPGSYPFFIANYNLSFRSTLWRPGLQYVGTNDWSFGASASQLSLSYGASWQHETELAAQMGDFGPSRTDFRRGNDAAFTELQGRFGARVFALAGARLEKFQGLPSELLPRASLVVAIVPERFAVRAAAGRAFKAPNIDQQYLDNPATIPNPNLKPERSGGWEVGATLTGAGRAFTMTIGYFRQRYSDIIETVPADTGTKATNKNLGSERSAGLELELERWWSPGIRTGVNVTWVRTTILDNRGLDSSDFPIGGSLPAIPRLTGNAFISADLSPRVTTFGRVTVVGHQTVLSERFSGQRVTEPAYALLEVQLQWHAGKAVDLYTRLNNLLDAKYQVAYDRPGMPRTAVVGVKVRP